MYICSSFYTLLRLKKPHFWVKIRRAIRRSRGVKFCDRKKKKCYMFVKFYIKCLTNSSRAARFQLKDSTYVLPGVNLMWSFASDCVSSCIWLDKPTDQAAECGSIEPNSLKHVKFCAIVCSFAWRIGPRAHAHAQKCRFFLLYLLIISLYVFLLTN